MILFLKILSLSLTGILGIWTAWSDFKEKNKKGVKKTIFLYGTLLIVLSVLSFWVENLEDNKKEVSDRQKFSNLIDSTKNLFDTTKKQMREQYEYLSILNEQLKTQNGQLKEQIYESQRLIDEQYNQSLITQERIKGSIAQSISMIDLLAYNLNKVNKNQDSSLKELLNISEIQKSNLTEISNINKELASVSLPISPFRIVLILRIELNDTGFVGVRKRPLSFYPKGMDLPMINSLELVKGGYHRIFGPISYDEIRLLNYEDLVKFFSSFSHFNVSLYSDTASSYDDIFKGNMYSNAERIRFNYKAEGGIPYYRYGEDSVLYQPIVVTFNSINSNSGNLRTLKDVFSNVYIAFTLHNLYDKGAYFSLKLKDIALNKTYHKKIDIKRISFLPTTTIHYGKDFSLAKEIKTPKNFKMPFMMHKWFDYAIEKFQIFEATMVCYVDGL